MVICHLCNDDYSEIQMEFHLLGVHGVIYPEEMCISSKISKPRDLLVVYLEKLPPAFTNQSFKITKSPAKIRKDYIIPKIRRDHYRLNDNRLKYCGLKK